MLDIELSSRYNLTNDRISVENKYNYRIWLWFPDPHFKKTHGGATDPFREMGAWRNCTETQQSGYAQRSGPEAKTGSSAKDGAPEKLICYTNISPPQHGGAVPAPLTRGGSKWRDNFPEGSDYPGTPNRLEFQENVMLLLFKWSHFLLQVIKLDWVQNARLE